MSLPLRARALVSLAVALVLTAAGVGLGVVLHSSTPKKSATPTPEDLAEVDTSTLVVQRANFCSGVSDDAVSTALGGVATDATSYDDGDKVRLSAEVKDIVQEYGCTWSGPRKTEAKAWVFAPPVTRGWATSLAKNVPDGCEQLTGPAYGDPSVTYQCTTRKRVTVSLRGLFGDAWLSCDLTGTRGEEVDRVAARARQFCLAAAVAAT
ncbi:MAG: hypothetical protein QM638_09080 [Nocardioides sp.]|uniref:hypothetical protein n=1 Tax=Nocardioides sp. TaxID=35761 RepID=UPI0039E63389